MFCEPRLEIMVAPVPKRWCETTINAAPMLSICSGRESCRSKLLHTPCGASTTNGRTTAATTAAVMPRQTSACVALAIARRTQSRAGARPPHLGEDADAEQAVSEAQPLDDRGERSCGQRGRPKIEPRKHHGAKKQRRDRSERKRAEKPRRRHAERRERVRERDDERSTAHRHEHLERPLVAALVPLVAQCGLDEHGQRARRILDGKVAVRNLPVKHGVAVGLVHGRVDDLPRENQPG
jgi:hypothetical protein